jgi:predicted ATPase
VINYLHIKNFKCFEALSLPLSPLTLLTGFNAAGKSTALQAILLLVQALREGGRSPLVPLNGSLVRLGTPGDVIHHGADSEISLGIECDAHSVDWRMATDDRRSGHVLPIKEITWGWGQEKERCINFEEGIENLLPSGASQTLQRLSKQLAQVLFIAATRTGTPEVFPAPTAAQPVWADVGAQGEFAAWWFEKLLDEDVELARHHPSVQASNLRKQFNAWASTLFPGAEANAQRIVGTSLIKLEFRNHGSDEWRHPANIGYGLTYAFPILVAGLIAKPGQMLVIDSPEAHLHPMGQSCMGEFLAMLARSGVHVVVETHSDHLLNGVRLAVNRGNMPPQDVGIHFFNSRPRSSADPAHVMSPKMDADGGISDWPRGFFDQAENDLAMLAGWK